MNSKVKKAMYTPMPRHRSGHEGSREIKSCLTTPSGGFAKTPHNFFSVLITKKNFDFADGKNFSFFLASNCDSKILYPSQLKIFLHPKNSSYLKFMTKLKGSLSIQNKTRRD